MNNIKKYFVGVFILVLTSIAIISCKQIDTMIYQQNAGVTFAPQSNIDFSFFNYPGMNEYICEFEARISGDSVNWDRKIDVIIAENDSINITTATSKEFEIIGGIVPAGKYKGKISIKVKATDEMKDSIFYAYFKIVPNEDFPLGGFDNIKVKLAMTKLVLKPRYWGNWTYMLGKPFSTNWYRFVLDAMNVDYIPYPAANTGDKKWTWQVFEANCGRVKSALIKYNNTHPGDKLKHLDGDFAGDEVVMP